MGTRSLTVMCDGMGDEIAVLYRQYDGYPEGHGKELAEFLSGFQIVNGFGETTRSLANGAGCLAAQIIAYFKKGVGGFYLHKAGTRNQGEEYIYYVNAHPDEPIELRVMEAHTTGNKMIFHGTPEMFLEWLKINEEKEND